MVDERDPQTILTERSTDGQINHINEISTEWSRDGRGMGCYKNPPNDKARGKPCQDSGVRIDSLKAFEAAMK
ncbi:hypothetical protein KIN20_025985 [Parelaphostrongylus tenuis]|uniref:Uncharacterized protein n=1 Tax=Parelaphostrongylus tenuis TaxID=148309 RepID=A0AAD5QXV0_PARTN|nr:hypothetical protein KIN20_025985 [Parelaphostrongylus tenuis]